MTDGSQFIDIILFAMVAVFLGLRLRSVLGRRTGEERPPEELAKRPPPGAKPDNVVPLPGLRPQPAVEQKTGSPLDEGLAAIGRVDSGFSPQAFLQGAGAAFEMIVGAFARGDEAALRPLLSDEVFAFFSQAIETRRTAHQICKSELVRVVSVDFEDAHLNGRRAEITVRFVSEQIVAVTDAEGQLVEGNLTQSITITDLWSFARDTRTSNPNWLLIATRSQDE